MNRDRDRTTIMPTNEEKLAQIEVALRTKYFAFIAKRDDYPNWDENQHDVNRLTRALAAFVIAGLCDIGEPIAASAVTDGDNDGGLDALYCCNVSNQLVIVQSKFKRNGAAPSQAENLKTINGVKSLLNRRFQDFNESIQIRLDEIEEFLDRPGVTIKIVLTYLGENFSPHVVADLNSLKDEVNVLTERLIWEPKGLSQIYDLLIAEQTPTPVTIEIDIENLGTITHPRKAVYGQIRALQLANLVEQYGKALFEKNIRHYLGTIGVNRAIEETVRRHPADFFYLNNGMTIVASRIEDAPGNNLRCRFRLHDASIVNGAQTAGSISNAACEGNISEDAKLMVTVIETSGGSDNISTRITQARNYQNVVRGVDFAALDPQQERLRQELAVMGVRYHYRPSADASVRRSNAFTLQDAALALACLSFPVLSSTATANERRNGHAVEFLVVAKKEIGRLWEQDGTLYFKLFNQHLSGLSMWRKVAIFRFIDSILGSTEKSETTYVRRMFFRHGRYFYNGNNFATNSRNNFSTEG